MLFLMNDAVLNLQSADLSPQFLMKRFAAISFDCVQSLGQELFSQEPLLQHVHPERAMKLAALLHCKAPQINAALFVAPAKGCPTAQVGVRYASVDVAGMANLQSAQNSGSLNAVFADNEVWRRLAA